MDFLLHAYSLAVNFYLATIDDCKFYFPFRLIIYLIKILVVNLADILVCPFILEFPFHKRVCFWVTCIRWLHPIRFPFFVPFASVEWLASSLHSLMGCQHLYFQCSIHILEIETWAGSLSFGKKFQFVTWLIINAQN